MRYMCKMTLKFYFQCNSTLNKPAGKKKKKTYQNKLSGQKKPLHCSHCNTLFFCKPSHRKEGHYINHKCKKKRSILNNFFKTFRNLSIFFKTEH